MTVLPISTVIPTLNRPERLTRTISSILVQDVVPREIIVVDSSPTPITAAELPEPPAGVQLRCLTAQARGAAAQRNQGVSVAHEPWILFTDDDIDLEPGCLLSLWMTIQSDTEIGACGVVITNQHYNPPGRLMRSFFALLGCHTQDSLAGRCVGPALNFLPEHNSPVDQPVEWMNLGCTLVRREALPQPPLLDFFHGYSLMEDVALSYHIGQHWRLSIPANARVFHDARPATYKDQSFVREKMEVVNRWFVMRHIMNRNSWTWDLRQLVWQGLSLALSLLTNRGWQRFPAALAGKIAGMTTVLLRSRHWNGYQPVHRP